MAIEARVFYGKGSNGEDVLRLYVKGKCYVIRPSNPHRFELSDIPYKFNIETLKIMREVFEGRDCQGKEIELR